MKIYIGIDPGKHKHAIVATDAKGNNYGGFLDSDKEDYYQQITELLRQIGPHNIIILTIEGQQFYRNQKGSVAGDLIDLAYETGRMYEKVHRVLSEDVYNKPLPMKCTGMTL